MRTKTIGILLLLLLLTFTVTPTTWAGEPLVDTSLFQELLDIVLEWLGLETSSDTPPSTKMGPSGDPNG